MSHTLRRIPTTPLLALSLLVIVAITGARAQTVATFDDIDTHGSALVPPADGYAGVNWSNFLVTDGSIYGRPEDDGYHTGIITQNNIALNGGGEPATLSDPNPFTLDSAYLSAAWNDDLNVEVKGFIGNTLAYDSTYTVSVGVPVLEDFNYVGVTSVEFISTGGTNAGWGGTGFNFVIDDIAFSPDAVPEPPAWALLFAGLATAFVVRHFAARKSAV